MKLNEDQSQCQILSNNKLPVTLKRKVVSSFSEDYAF